MEPKILTVDDSKALRLIVTGTLRPFACKILEAADGIQGLDLASRHRPDLILLDCDMPRMNGLEMLACLKADPELRVIPVIMLTADSGRTTVVNVAKLGVVGFMVKPFKPEDLLERVGRILELKPRSQIPPRIRHWNDRLKILVVEDKPPILEQFKAGLAGTGWTMHGAPTQVQALDFCDQASPDIIFISLSLPGNSAFTLFQRLRAHLSEPPPILGLSVNTAIEEQAQANELGFEGTITKPIVAEDLQSKIVQILKLDISHKYFHRKGALIVLALPASFNPVAANDVGTHLRQNIVEAVGAGLLGLILDLSAFKVVDSAVIVLAVQAIQLCSELALAYRIVACEAFSQECKNNPEAKDWKFVASFDEASASLNGKTPSTGKVDPASPGSG